MNHDIITFLQGISATAAWASGLLFVRVWRQTHDSLFGFFGVAFWLLAASWALLAVFAPTEETRPYIYGIRLLAFILLIIGMVAKNRRIPRESPGV
jgi:drug/metabolite transporter (DMT)-like permease